MVKMSLIICWIFREFRDFSMEIWANAIEFVELYDPLNPYPEKSDVGYDTVSCDA